MITSYIRGEKLTAWEVFVLRRLYNWAGHVARLQQQEPRRLTSRVLAFRCCRALEAHAFLTGGWQGHSGRYYVHNWERQFHDFFVKEDVDWDIVAMNKKTWNAKLSGWSRWKMKALASPGLGC